MLKVVMISPLPPQKTGESTYTASLIEKLSVNEQINIVAIAGPEAYNLPDQGGLVKTLPIWKGRSLLYPFKLLKAIAKERPHIVHVQFGPHGAVYGGFFGEPMIALLIMLKMIGIKTTITNHSTWMPHQVVERVASYRIVGKLSFLAAPAFRLFMKLLRWGLTKIQLSTVCIDSELKRRFIQEYGYSSEIVDEIPFPCRQVKKGLIPNASEQIGITDKKIILIFGYIRRGKGYEIAIPAMTRVKAEYPNALLLIAGQPLDNDGREYLKELVLRTEEQGLADVVRFDSKYIPDDKVHLYFSAADIILVPYTESIGASAPVHNNADYARPIVASDVGYHMKESIGGMLTLFRNRDSKGLSEKILTLLKDDQLCSDICKGIKTYANKETWDLAAKRTARHYRSLID
ncbi:MAG: glycosyltransferase [Candidatus Thorarchaeota archaeon]